MTYPIRPVSEFDLQQIRHINDTTQSFPWSANALLSEFQQNDPHSCVALDAGGAVVGYVFTRSVGDEIEVISLGVGLSWKRKGVGRSLITYVRAKLATNSTTIFLEVSALNVPALSLYESQGFQTVSIRKKYYPDGSDAVCMKLNLAKT